MRFRFLKPGDVKLYHKDVYMPEELLAQAKQLIRTVDATSPYSISRHVYESLTGKTEGWSHQLNYVPFVRAFNNIKKDIDLDIFEIETTNDVVTKCVARTSYSHIYDISFVVRSGIIVTAWKNRKGDAHYTLDISKYEKDTDEYFSEEDFADDLEFVEE